MIDVEKAFSMQSVDYTRHLEALNSMEAHRVFSEDVVELLDNAIVTGNAVTPEELVKKVDVPFLHYQVSKKGYAVRSSGRSCPGYGNILKVWLTVDLPHGVNLEDSKAQVEKRYEDTQWKVTVTTKPAYPECNNDEIEVRLEGTKPGPGA